MFGFYNPKTTSDYNTYIGYIIIGVYTIVIFFGIGLFASIYRQTYADISEKLPRLGFNLQILDVDTSILAKNVSEIYDTYAQSSGNIFAIHSGQITQISDYVQNPHSYIYTHYSDHHIVQWLRSRSPYIYDIYDIIGREGDKYYAILLMNSNEVRPAGGFFGSFLVLHLRYGRLIESQIYDSYLINRINGDYSLDMPRWLSQIYGSETISFISSNKIGFTNLDAQNIIKLLNHAALEDSKSNSPLLIYPHIDGVIAIDSAVATRLLPDLQPKIRERQFINANIDHISSGNANKKTIFIQDLQKYINKNKNNIIKTLISNINKLQNRIQIYIPDANISLVSHLAKIGRSRIRNTQYTYLYDSNRSYSKIDGFVSKTIYLSQGYDKLQCQKDICPYILDQDQYIIDMQYKLNIPDKYQTYISGLYSKYNISMQDREKTILGLSEIVSYQSIAYIPDGYIATSVSGVNVSDIQILSNNAMGNIVTYKHTRSGNNTSSQVQIYIKKT